jgi:hypothetical protein
MGMKTVTVRAIGSFCHAGREYVAGHPITLAPIEALILARRRLVTLALDQQPDEDEIAALAVVPRRRGRPRKSEYARRDLVAES